MVIHLNPLNAFIPSADLFPIIPPSPPKEYFLHSPNLTNKKNIISKTRAQKKRLMAFSLFSKHSHPIPARSLILN